MSTASDLDDGGSTSGGSVSDAAATSVDTPTGTSCGSCQLRTLLGPAVAVAPEEAIENAETTAAALVRENKISSDEQAGAEAIALLVQNPMVTIPSQEAVPLHSLLADTMYPDHPLQNYRSRLIAALERIEATDHPTLIHTVLNWPTELSLYQRIVFPGLSVCSTKHKVRAAGGTASIFSIENARGRDVSLYGDAPGTVVLLPKYCARPTKMLTVEPEAPDYTTDMRDTALNGTDESRERLNMYRASRIVMDVGATALRKLFLKAFEAKHGISWQPSFGKVFVEGGYYHAAGHGDQVPGTIKFTNKKIFKGSGPRNPELRNGERLVVGTDVSCAFHAIKVADYTATKRDDTYYYTGKAVGDINPRLKGEDLVAFRPGAKYQEPACLRKNPTKPLDAHAKAPLLQGDVDHWDCTVLNKALLAFTTSVLGDSSEELKIKDAVRYFIQCGRNAMAHCSAYRMEYGRFKQVLAAFDVLLEVGLGNDPDIKDIKEDIERQYNEAVGTDELPEESVFQDKVKKLEATLLSEAMIITLQSLPPEVEESAQAVPHLEALDVYPPPPLPSDVDMALKRLQDKIADTAITVLPNTCAASHLVLAAVAVSVCEKANDYASSLSKARGGTAVLDDVHLWASHLQSLTKTLKGGRMDILAYFDRAGESQRADAADLLGAAFFAMRIPAAVETDAGNCRSLFQYLKANTAAAGLEAAHRVLTQLWGGICLGKGSETRVETKAADPGRPQQPQPLLQKLTASSDAIDLWHRRCGFDRTGSIDKLLEQLDELAEDNGIMLRCNAVDSVKLREFFGSRGATETRVGNFARFVVNHVSVLTALGSFLGYASGDVGMQSHELLDSQDGGEVQLHELLDPRVMDLESLQAAYLDGTRKWVFDELKRWARLTSCDPDHRCLWLQGVGGMGKSVIAAQIVQQYDESEDRGGLGTLAYFFCKHNESSRSDPRRAVATLAYQLSELVDGMKSILQARLKNDEFVAYLRDRKGSFADMFEVVLAAPMREALHVQQAHGDIFILIDALDEVTASYDRLLFLDLVGRKLPSLPDCVRLIVTSRPEDDIVRTLHRLRPLVLGKEDGRLRQDTKAYVRREIVARTSLRSLNANERKFVTQLIVDRCDNMLLAARCARDLLQDADGERPLTLDQVEALVRSSKTLIFDFYRETLGRIEARLVSLAKGDKAQLRVLHDALQNVLQVLVVMREPVSARTVAELAGANALSVELLRALSLLYAAPTTGGGLEPMHKTVTDFLVSPSAAGKWVISEDKAHALLAINCWRVLECRGLLAQPRLIAPEDAVLDEVARYCIAHGHVYMTKCATTSKTARDVWATGMLKTREMPAQLPTQYECSEAEATAAFGQWLLLASHAAQKKLVLAPELRLFAEALRESVGREDALARLMDDTARLYGTQWVSGLTTRSGAACMFNNCPATSPLALSAAREVVFAVIEGVAQLLQLPAALSCGSCLQTLEGHGETVTSVAYSPDGRRIVSGSSDKSIRVWIAATGEKQQTLEGHSQSVTSVAYSPDGQRIVSGGWDKSVRVWIAATGEQLQTLEGHSQPVTSVAYSPDGQHIVSGSWDRSVRVWDTAMHEQPKRLEGHILPVTSVAYSRDGRRIASGSWDKTVRVWNAATGEPLHTLEGHRRFVTSVAYRPNGQHIVSGSGDETVRVWDTTTGEERQVLEAHSSSHDKGIISVTYSPDGCRIASSSSDRTVRVWDALTGEQLQTLMPQRSLFSLAYSPDGRRIVSGSSDKTVRVWDATMDGQPPTLEGHRIGVKSVAYSPDGRRIVSGGWDKTVRVWDAATGEQLKTLEGHSQPVTSVAYSPIGRRIVSGSNDKTVRVWNAATGEPLRTLFGHIEPVISVAYSPGGKNIVSGSWDTTVRVWIAATGEQLRLVKGHSGGITSVAYKPDGQFIVSGCGDNTLRVWSTTTWDQLWAVKGLSGGITSVSYSPDGGNIVSGGGDKAVRVWRAATGEPLYTMEGHSQFVASVAYSPDGRRIVSCSGDKTVRVWNASNGEQLQTLEGHSQFVLSVAYSPDGRRIVSGSYDKTVRVWDSTIGEQIQTQECHSDLSRS